MKNISFPHIDSIISSEILYTFRMHQKLIKYTELLYGICKNVYKISYYLTLHDNHMNIHYPKIIRIILGLFIRIIHSYLIIRISKFSNGLSYIIYRVIR
jgi:hypothetical protein